MCSGFVFGRVVQRLHLTQLGLSFNRYQMVQLYATLGGIPHYLRELVPGKSAIRNIAALCFYKRGTLSDEFERLYPALLSQ